MNFNNLKVKNKITVVIIAVAIIASISGIVSIFMMNSIKSEYDYALVNYGFAQGDVGAIMGNLARLDCEIHDSVGYLNEEASVTAANRMPEFVSTIDEYFDKVEVGLVTEESRSIFNTAKTAWGNYQSLANNLVQITLGSVDSELVADVQARLRNELDPYFDTVYDNMTALMELKVRQGDEAADDCASKAMFSVIMVCCLVVLAMILGFVFSAKIANGIAKGAGARRFTFAAAGGPQQGRNWRYGGSLPSGG